MKLILENMFWVLKRLLCQLLFFVFLATPSLAQHAGERDSTGGPTGYEDSATSAVQADTTAERTNYFDHPDSSPANFQLREVPSTVMDSLKKDDAFWYANKVFRRKTANADVRLPTRWMDLTTLVIIVVIFIAILAWYLFQNNIIKRRQAVTAENSELEEENIFSINYDAGIDTAVNAGNYRLAVRLMFLRLLKKLSEKNIIQYKQGRTNFDYLAQLHPGIYYQDFFRLTRSYEYAWYGKFEVSRVSFGIIRNDFENFDRRLS